MKGRHLFALITCLLAGAILCGTLVAKKYWREQHLSQSGSTGQYDNEHGPGNSNRLFEVEFNALRVVEPFVLTERSGEPFDSTDLDGKLWIGSFFFSSCPEICRNQNAKISRVLAELPEHGISEEDVTFVSISVNPKWDTPPRLRTYATEFGADDHNWKFLTGEMETIQGAGASFGVSIDTGTHASSLLLVDRFGRFRDRFSWDDNRDMDRMQETIKELRNEASAPFGKQVTTRAVPRVEEPSAIKYAHGDWNSPELTTDYLLTGRDGVRFDSRDMLGKTWVASFFFSRCPSICKEQNVAISRLSERLADLDLAYVSITSDPDYDTPVVLREYAEQFKADEREWCFLTGEPLQVERIGSEVFGVAVAKEMHSTKLMLVDRWGNVRGRFSWQEESDMERFRLKVDEVMSEKIPPDVKQIAADLAKEMADDTEDSH